MLVDAEISAIVPRVRCGQGGRLLRGRVGPRAAGASRRPVQEPGGRAGDGTLVVYESVAAGQSKGTLAAFRVADLESVVAGLRERGVAFEEYNLPDLKTENAIATIGDLLASWARDPDGNIIAFEQRT